MATPETAVAPPPPDPRKPSAAATLAAAANGTVAAGRVAVKPTLVVAGVATRAVAAATEQVIEALANFARQRQATIIPALQRQLVETFVDRTPDEIAKLLGREIARERMFLRRQAIRMQRDLPDVLGEADVDVRRAKMEKLLSREKRYMGLREQAMTARAHSVVESLALQEASPEGAFWKLGGAIHHTPGCIAMSGKFWPWEVLREVAIPPVHPGCACQLIGLHEASKHGLVVPHQLPDVKDALLRARRNMALEEAIADALPELAARGAVVEAYLREAEERYGKGLARGGEFMPGVGGDFTGAKGALRKLLPHGLTKRGASRHVWIKGHQVQVKPDTAMSRKFGSDKFTSPMGSTNVYRNGDLASVDGEPDTHPDLQPPTNAAAAAITSPNAAPAPIVDAESAARTAARSKIEQRMADAPKNPPVKVGEDAKATHDGLLAAGFQAGKSKGSKASLKVEYEREGAKLALEYGRKSGAIEDMRWTPSMTPSKPSKPGKGSAAPWGKKPSGDWHTGASLFSNDEAPKKPFVPIPPIEHPALISEPAAPGPIANFDHVALTQKAHSTEATAADGTRFHLHQGEQDHIASQLLAHSVYRELGIPVPVVGVRNMEEPDFAKIPDVDLGEGPIDAGTKRTSSGIILRHPNGDVTIFEPRNHFGGYEHTFPKGGVEAGLTAQQNAHKELWEETGLHARITGLVGDYDGTTSVSRYYTGVMTGGTPTAGPETESVKTVAPEEAAKLLNTARDQEILKDVLANHPVPTGDPGPDAFPESVRKPALLATSVGGKSLPKGPSAELGKGYMADALLGNWDAVGKDAANVRQQPDGTVVRTSLESALGYRAGGAEKPFGAIPTEAWTLRSPKGQHFGESATTEDERRGQAAAIAKALPAERLDALVNAAPFASEDKREAVRTALTMRTAWMGAYGRGDVNEPETLQGPAAAAELTHAQEGLDLFPEQHAALAMYPEEMDAIEAHAQSGAKTTAPTEDQRLIVKELDSVLRFARTDEDVIAYHGMDANVGADSVGKTLSSKGYLHMSLAEGEARKSPTVLQITIPGGSHALYTRGIAGVDAADVDARTPDMLGQRGARLRVVGHAERDGKTYVEAVLLP